MKYLSNNINTKKIIYDLKNNKSIICIGFFDSIHIGHIKIINKTLEIAKKENLKTIFFTFSSSSNLFKAKKKNIFSDDYRKNIIKKMCFDYYYDFNLDINDSFKISKYDFLKFLQSELFVKKIVVGENFRFGYKASGSIKDLFNFFGKENVNIIKLLKNINNENISSTLIKSLLIDGKIEKANNLLYNHYQCFGKVIHGTKKGRTINFPTANIKLQNKLLIPDGSYITKMCLGKREFNSISCVYSKNNIFLVETHILNKDLNLYDKEVIVKFCKFIYEFKKMNSLDEVKHHINDCSKKAIDYFKK